MEVRRGRNRAGRSWRREERVSRVVRVSGVGEVRVMEGIWEKGSVS